MPAYCLDCDEGTTFLDIVTDAGHLCTNDDCPRDRVRYPDTRWD